MWEHALEVARMAVAWRLPPSVILGMSRLEQAAMDQAHSELDAAIKRAQRKR